VRYEPDSPVPAHDHPDGEEILVLEGVFSDEHGDWPAGTYLLNPEGFRHAPFSEHGCVIFVKLRQFPGRGREHVALDANALPWRPGEAPGVEVKPLYAQAGFADTMRLERWAPGAAACLTHEGGAEAFVIEGALQDDDGAHAAGSWLRLPRGAQRELRAPSGCLLYVKRGGFRYLAEGDDGA
jgi:anti-sigma factor ChrR (cupin superfamily)